MKDGGGGPNPLNNSGSGLTLPEAGVITPPKPDGEAQPPPMAHMHTGMHVKYPGISNPGWVGLVVNNKVRAYNDVYENAHIST